mgnify:CR=1 FL=1
MTETTTQSAVRYDKDADNIVVDIGRAGDAVREVLGALNFRNLDDEPAFRGRNTTTEFLASVVHERVARKIAAGELGPVPRDHRPPVHPGRVRWQTAAAGRTQGTVACRQPPWGPAAAPDRHWRRPSAARP